MPPDLARAQESTAGAWTDPSPHRRHMIAVAPDVQLEVLDWGGTGPAMLFLAGLGNSAHVFDDFAPRFRDRFRVYALTRRGFGRSSAPAGGYDAATRARDIVAVLDSLRVQRAVLVGHSVASDELGAVGARYPSRVRALVYLDAYDYTPARLAAMQAAQPPPQVWARMTAADSASAEATAAYGARSFGVTVPPAELRELYVFGPDGRLVANGRGADAIPRVLAGTEAPPLSRIRAPALAIFAVLDDPARMYPRYAILDSATRAEARRSVAALADWRKLGRDRFRAEVRRGTVVEIPGGHHYVFISHSDRVERAMRDFLARFAER